MAIAIDSARREIVVSDRGDPDAWIRARLLIFSYGGVLLKTISGKAGMFGNRFSSPQGLAVDNGGHIFMLDSYSGEIMAFKRHSGALVKTMAGFGDEEGKLRLPLDLWIDEETLDIYVTNNRGSKLDKFEAGAMIP